MGRMKHLWGEDAEDFCPERWLQNGSFQPETPFKFISFNVSSHLQTISLRVKIQKLPIWEILGLSFC